MKPIIITGGGTGGHAIPAALIGQALRTRLSCEVHFIGNPAYIEKSIAKQEGFPFHPITSQGMEGPNVIAKWGGFICRNALGTLQAIRIVKKLDPSLIVATGGFVSAPVMAAARLLGVPYVIHEQNSVAGKVNRIFQQRASLRLTSLPFTEGIEEALCVGNPVRFNAIRTESGSRLVVLGGSGGSILLNEWAVRFAHFHPEVPITIQAGVRHEKRVKEEVASLPHVKVVGFCDLNDLYASARLAVTRGGTGVLFDLANQAIPSVVVPLSTSADGHQSKNASHFEQGGGMIKLEENEVDERLSDEVQRLWSDDNKRREMKNALVGHSGRDAATSIAGEVAGFIGKDASEHGKLSG